MSFSQAVATCFKKYFDFSGRATRSEYWWFALFYLLAAFVFTMLVFFLRTSVPALLILVLIIPTLTVTVRRLHDTSRSGWYYFVSFIPIIGGLILLVILCQEQQRWFESIWALVERGTNTDPYLQSNP